MRKIQKNKNFVEKPRVTCYICIGATFNKHMAPEGERNERKKQKWIQALNKVVERNLQETPGSKNYCMRICKKSQSKLRCIVGGTETYPYTPSAITRIEQSADNGEFSPSKTTNVKAITNSLKSKMPNAKVKRFLHWMLECILTGEKSKHPKT